MSTIDGALTSPIRPAFIPPPNSPESSNVQKLVDKLGLLKHPEGGYFAETDRDLWRVPNPFQSNQSANQNDDSTRAACTTIFYLLTPGSPKGGFHRNKARTMHTLHRGRGRYVIIHADEKHDGQKARIETFIVGQDIHKGERLQWLVEGGKYKASYLLPDNEGGSESDGLLISEVSKTPMLIMFVYHTESS